LQEEKVLGKIISFPRWIGAWPWAVPKKIYL